MRSYVSIDVWWEEYFLKRSRMYKGSVAGKVSAYGHKEVRVFGAKQGVEGGQG